MSDKVIGFSGPATADDSDLHAQLASLEDGGGPPSLDQIISACPRVLTEAWQSRSGLSSEVLAALRAYRTGLDEGTRLWPWGIGPLEQLFEGLDRAFGLDAARSLAVSPLVTVSLSQPYLASACEQVKAALNSNDLRRARRLHEVLLAAVASDGVGDPARCRALVWRTWLDVAKTVLGQLPDDSLFTSASGIEASLLALAESLGDMAMACDARYGFAGVLTAPYIAGDPKQFKADIERWHVRGMDAGLPRAEVIPPPEAAFKLAEGRLRRALDDAVNGRLPAEGRIRALLAVVLFRQHVTRTQSLDPEIIASIAGETERALAALPSTDPSVRLEMHMILSALRRTSDTSEAESICREPVDDLIARYGLNETYRIITLATQVLTASQPDLALLYLASLEVFQRRLPEHLRALFLRLHTRTLLDGNTAEHARSLLAVLPPDQLVDGEALLKALEEQAGRGGWTPAEILRCALLVASPDVIVPEAVLPVLDWVTRLAPFFARQHRDAISYLVAGRAGDTAQTVYSLVMGKEEPQSDGDPAAFVAYFAEALTRYCDLELVEGTLQCLDVLRNVVVFGGRGVAELVIRALSGRLGRVEALGGEQALQVIATLTNVCVGSLLNEGAGGPVLEALLWGKGHAFASAQAIGATFDVKRDEEAIEMLGRIREIEAGLGSAADADDGLDDRRLLVPYAAAQEEWAEAGAAQMLRSLQHSFDEHVERKIMTAALSGDTPAWRTWRWSVDEVVESLPGKTALMILYLSELQPARMVAAILTSEQVYLTYATPDASDDALELMQMTTHAVRDTVQKDPGPRVVDRDGGMLLERGMSSFLGRAADLLADLRGRGYDHLIVVPHGPFHYFPIHLLGPPGKPLSADWLVTLQPSPLSVVTADEQPRRRRTTGAAVLGIDFRDYPGGTRFEPLEGVAEEVRAVAAAVGGQPMLNEQVTRSSVAEALQKARWVHLATHGLANAYAPCFDALAVWPDEGGTDRLAAHELLGMDLRGLELVTLSACETALGRFDVADNRRGLTATLLRAGARAVMGTLWPVETDTSTDFFTAVYAELGRGATIGEAYSAAQRRTRQVHPQYRDWGAFVLLGSWID